jgi:myosin protein heavy chain
MDMNNKLKEDALKQAIKEIQRDAEEVHSTKNDVLSQSKDLEKKIKSLEADLAQLQEDLSAAERQRRMAEAERDELAEELSATGSKVALAINAQKMENSKMMLERQNKERKVKFEVENSNWAKANAAIGGLQMGEAAHVFSGHCTALHCTALHCTALHCTALHCTALQCIVRH